MITTAIIWDHRNRTKAGQEGPLEVRVTIDRKIYYVNTGIKVRKNEWKHGIIVSRIDNRDVQARLNIIYKRIEEELNDALDEGRDIDVADIKRRAWAARVDNDNCAFLDFINEQINNLNVSHGTVKHYDSLYRRLKSFGKMTKWRDVTVENIYNFDSWLRKQTKRQSEGDRLARVPAEPIGDSGVYNYHKCLKALLNKAVLFGKLDHNPYELLKGKFKRGDRERVDFLTDEEMEAFVSLSPVPGSKMAMARDLFVFQMYTGLSFSDTQHFDIGDYKLIDGVWRNTGERIKTGTPYTSQLLPPVVEVLEKYHWQIPRFYNADYNHCLKALGIACGIERPIHSHMGRHTFATFMLRHGVPIEHVSKMLGHTNITQTQRYAKIVAKDIHDDFNKIAEQMRRK